MLDKKPLILIMGSMHNAVARVLCNLITALYKVLFSVRSCD